ncbi:MAG: cell division protein SepF [Parasporobacterium sp.]|nr:cell division protein SepF [Parasporobacterium sp.]
MGKFTDKFMNAFNSGKDDDYDDFDDIYDGDDIIDEDDTDEPEEKGGFFKKRAAQAEEKEVREQAPKSTSGAFGRNARSSASRSNPRMGGSEVCIFKPSSIEDSREITETLLQGKAVVINFEGLHVEISQRIIDFISGSCYALDGNLQKISNYIFIATPNSVDISGDFQDLFGNDDGSFDITGFKSPLI